MFYIVSYDIADDKRRNKLAGVLKDFGTRVHYSVFECILDDNKFYDKMIYDIEDIIDKDKDSVRVYALCSSCEQRMEIIGAGIKTKDKDVYII